MNGYGMAACGAKRPFIDKQQALFPDKWFFKQTIEGPSTNWRI
jgi:hypothetical protein